MKSTIETIRSEFISELKKIGFAPMDISPLSLAKENEARGVYKLTKGEEQQLKEGSIVDLVILNYFKHFKERMTTVEKANITLLNVGNMTLKKPWLISRMPFIRDRINRYQRMVDNTPKSHPLYQKRVNDVVRIKAYYNELYSVLPLIKDMYENAAGKNSPEKDKKRMEALQSGSVENYNELIKVLNEGQYEIEIKSEPEPQPENPHQSGS